MTLRTLNYGNYGIFLIMGSAGFCPSAVVPIYFEIYSLPVVSIVVPFLENQVYSIGS